MKMRDVREWYWLNPIVLDKEYFYECGIDTPHYPVPALVSDHDLYYEAIYNGMEECALRDYNRQLD